MNIYDNKEKLGLNKSESKDNKYILFPFITLYPPLSKELNHLTDLGKELNSLNHLIYIPKIGNYNNC